MIRKRPNAENTMKSHPPKNAYWELTKAGAPCPYCGRLHDEAGRTLDERGKLMDQPARPDQPRMKPCPRVATEKIKEVQKQTVKVNRMLGTERERISRIRK